MTTSGGGWQGPPACDTPAGRSSSSPAAASKSPGPSTPSGPTTDQPSGAPNGGTHAEVPSSSRESKPSSLAPRNNRACDGCRARKVKCLFEPGRQDCHGCTLLQIRCTHNRPRRKRGPPNRYGEDLTCHAQFTLQFSSVQSSSVSRLLELEMKKSSD